MRKLLFLLFISPLVSKGQDIIPHYQALTELAQNPYSNIKLESDSLFYYLNNMIILVDAIPPDNVEDSIKKQRGLQWDISLLDTLIHRDYELKSVYYLKAIAFKDIYDYYNAIQTANLAIFYDSTNVDIYVIRGTSKSQLGDYYGALNDYNKAITRAYKTNTGPSQLSDLYCKRADCRYTLVQHNKALATSIIYTQALSDINQAITLNSKAGLESGLQYFIKGIILFSLEQKQSALQALSKSGELGYQNAYNAIKIINE